MSDSGSMNLDLGVNLGVTLNGAGLQELSNTIKEISKGKDLQRYWKDVESATDSAAKAIERYNKNVNSKGLAENLLKQINALKALTKKENLSELFPNMELNLDELVESAKKIVPQINSQFSVDSFSQAFKTFDLLKEKSIDLTEAFRKLADYADLVSRNSELSRENSQFRELIGDSDVEEVKSKLSEIKRLRDQAEEIFTSFLKVNNVERTDYWGDEKFSDYFDAIRKGSLTATEAISRFKTEYAYLLEEGFKSNNDTFGLEQLQAFSNKLDSIFRQVEETSTKINDIISNGVITKSVENLSMDSSLSDSQRSLFGNLLQDEESLKSITALFQKLIEESNKTSKVDLFNDEQLQQVLSIFDKMEKHLSSLRSIISDVGDGEEFSPLIKMINNVQSSISELATSVKGIGFNMNIDVGSNSEMETKVQSKIANALQAYQRLFDHIKMSSAGGQIITNKFFDFDINQYDTMMGKLQAYKKFIDNMRKEAKTQFNGKDVLYQDTEKSYWTQASAAMGQVTKAFNEMNAASDTNPLADMFGKTDLSEVIEQLNKIVSKLDEISSSASEFKNVFKDGFNVTASVEEIDKLTNRVKELEDELSKIKLNPISVDKSNISSGNKIKDNTNSIQKQNDALKELILSWMEAQKIMTKSGSQKIEKLAVGNIDTGYASNANVTGDLNEISSKLINNVINAAEEKINTMIHSHPGSNVAAFSPEDIQSAIINYVKGLENQIVVGMNEVSIMDVSKLKDVNPIGIAQKVQLGIDNLIDSYVKNKLQTINGFQNALNNKFGYDANIWEDLTDLLSERSNSDLLSNIIQKYKSEIADSLTYFASDKTFNTSNELCDLIYDGVIKKYINKYIKEINPDINQSDFDALHQKMSESFKTTFSDMYEKILSIDDYKGLVKGDDFQSVVKEAFSNFLKTIGIKYEDVIKTISLDKLQSPDFQMKDVFQGNDKATTDASTTAIKEESKALEQVSNSAKEASESKENFSNANKEVKSSAESSSTSLDEEKKKIENVGDSAEETKKKLDDVVFKPNTEGFDEIVSKLDIAKDKIEEISKITKSSVWSESQGEYLESYNIKYKNGTSEIRGESSNKKGSNVLRANEVAYDAKAAEQEAKAVKEVWNKNVKAIQDYMDAVTKLNNLNAKDKGTGKYASQITLQEKNVEELKEKALEARTAITSMINPHDVSLNTWRDYLDVMEKFSQASLGSAESVAKLEDALRKMDFSSLESAGTKFKSQFDNLSIKPDGDHQFLSWTNDLKELNAKIDEYNSKVKYLKENNIVDGEQVVEVKNLRDEIEEIINVMTKTPQSKRGWTDIGASKAAEKVANVLKQNTKMSKEAKDAIRAYYNELRSGNPSQPIDEILVKVNQLVQKERELRRVGKSFGEIFKEKVIYGAAAQLAGMVGFYDVINVIRQAGEAVIDLNTNITELAKVSDVSVSSVYQDFQSYADISKEIGGTISDTISATADWSRNGYSLPDSKQLAEVAQLYKNVGDGIDIDEANASLISTLQGFQLEADQAEHIIDVFNEVSNNEPIDSGGIGDALQRSAASFNAANTSLEKSVSLIAGTNSVLQDAEKVGNMWKTVSARMRGADAELKEMGEDTDGMVTSTSKLRDLVKGMTGFDIMKDDNTFKDIYDIVVGIGEKWSDLSDVNQAALLEKLAGKNQSNALAAALANVDTIKKAYGEATNAEGSAREEQEKFADSIQYSINQIQASLEELSNDVLNSDFLKGAIDAGKTFVEVLDKIVDGDGVLPVALTGIAGILSVKDNTGKLTVLIMPSMPKIILQG